MEDLTKKASQERKRRVKLCKTWATYILVCTFLFIMNAVTSPSYLWVFWVIGGWGLAVAVETTFYLIEKKV